MTSRGRSFFDELLLDAVDVRRTKGIIHLFPYWIAGCIGVGSGVAYAFPEDFFLEQQWGTAATIYSGVLAFNAITLALSWSAISRILEVASSPGFAAFLKSSDMLNRYSFYVSYIHYCQVIAAFATLAALLGIFLAAVPLWGDKVLLAAVVATTLYALRWSLASVRIATDLIEHFATFDGLDKSEKQALRMAVNNQGKGDGLR